MWREKYQTLVTELYNKEQITIQSQQNLQHATSHIEHLEIELKKSQENENKYLSDIDMLQRSILETTTQINNSYNIQMFDLKQLYQVYLLQFHYFLINKSKQHSEFLIDSNQILSKVSDVTEQILLDLQEQRHQLLQEQIHEIELQMERLETVLETLDQQRILQVFNMLPSVHNSSEDQSNLDSKLDKLSKLLSGQTPVSTREEIIKSKLNVTKHKIQQLYEELNQNNNDDLVKVLEMSFNKLDVVSSSIQDLSEQIKHIPTTNNTNLGNSQNIANNVKKPNLKTKESKYTINC